MGIDGIQNFNIVDHLPENRPLGVYTVVDRDNCDPWSAGVENPPEVHWDWNKSSEMLIQVIGLSIANAHYQVLGTGICSTDHTA